MITTRRRRRAESEHRADVTAKILVARELTLGALHEATDPVVLEYLLDSVESLDRALALIEPRLTADHDDLREALAARSPRI